MLRPRGLRPLDARGARARGGRLSPPKTAPRPGDGLVALLTDFGLEDPYVGVMKGVLLGRCPGARVVDLCHGIRPQDLRQGAFALMSSVEHFPDGTLFVCVVDPGVGSGRAIVWARGRRHSFLAPDNGLLSWAARVEPLLELREVRSPRLRLARVSRTFHGRDVFAPAAAALACGLAPAELGPRRRSLVRLPFPAVRRSGSTLRGEVLALDRFGNAVTNIRPSDLPRGARLEARGSPVGPLRARYSSVEPGQPLALAGSHGFVELSVRDGSFAATRSIGPGDPIFARRRP